MSKRRIRMVSAALLATALFLLSCSASARNEVAEMKAQAEQVASNKQVVQTFLGLFMSGNWDDLNQVIAADCVLHEPGGEDIVGLDAMRNVWQVVYGALKDMRATPRAEVSEGEFYMTLLTIEAMYEGEYMGQQIAGVPVKYNQAETMHIVDGKIVEWWVSIDRLWMSEQLGFELRPR